VNSGNGLVVNPEMKKIFVENAKAIFQWRGCPFPMQKRARAKASTTTSRIEKMITHDVRNDDGGDR